MERITWRLKMVVVELSEVILTEWCDVVSWWSESDRLLLRRRCSHASASDIGSETDTIVMWEASCTEKAVAAAVGLWIRFSNPTALTIFTQSCFHAQTLFVSGTAPSTSPTWLGRITEKSISPLPRFRPPNVISFKEFLVTSSAVCTV